MVIYGARIITGLFNLIIPATLKTTILAPPSSQAHLKLPSPSSLRLVTTSTFPPLPPKLNLPPPSAPGNAGTSDCGRSVGLAAQGTNGFPFFASASIMGTALAHAMSDLRRASFIIESDDCCTSRGTEGY